MIKTLNLTQFNWKTTRQRVNQRSTLLDLFLTNWPEKFALAENQSNFSSEHEATVTEFADTDFQCQKQFRII